MRHGKRHDEIKRCRADWCAGKKPGGAPTGKPRPVYAEGLCWSHYQESLSAPKRRSNVKHQ